jgi:hypothetical protein
MQLSVCFFLPCVDVWEYTIWKKQPELCAENLKTAKLVIHLHINKVSANFDYSGPFLLSQLPKPYQKIY